MKKVEGKQTILTWNSKKYGVCEATIWNGKLTDFRFCKEGSNLATAVYSGDIKYLKELHKVLGELFVALKELPSPDCVGCYKNNLSIVNGTDKIIKMNPLDKPTPLPELEPLDWNTIGGPFSTTTCFRVLRDKINSLIAHVKKLEGR